MRKLTAGERTAIEALAARLSTDARKQLLLDLEDSSVDSVTPDGSRLRFHIPNYERPAYRGQHAYDAEGAVNDSDGKEVSVSLYADENNRLLELELIKWGEGPLISPDWNSFRVKY